MTVPPRPGALSGMVGGRRWRRSEAVAKSAGLYLPVWTV